MSTINLYQPNVEELVDTNITVIVNFFGGPGSGKSTLAAGLFNYMKKNNMDVELCTEYAKDLTWEKRYGALSVQPYVFGKQLMRLERVYNQVDVIITDSPLLLGLIYNTKWGDCFNSSVIDIFNRYTNVNLVIKRSKPYNPSGRNQSETEAKQIDLDIINMLNKYNVLYDMITYNGVSDNLVYDDILCKINYKKISPVTKRY